jgi:xylan 1,4-beta-xylosidase
VKAVAQIKNPILKGFNPDPSILRVQDDYYIATSTFEWFPGVQIHHSKDLIHWQLLTRPLNESRLLNMRGNPSSGGVWAPCLSYHNHLFYLVYTDVKSNFGAFKDTHNYLITSDNIMGPWSDPVYLNSSGFDPSLFHDGDGKKWLVNMIWDHRKNHYPFGGIVLQEYSEFDMKLIGPKKIIFKGTHLGCTEAPHLYRHNGYYYLMTAEGGTGYEHAVTVARSTHIQGPYEVDPQNPILSSIGGSELTLQKSGHASIVETQQGEWYLAHLCSRPIASVMRCTLGRETALQKCHWNAEGWLRLEGNVFVPNESLAAPVLPIFITPQEPDLDDFDDENLSIHWNTLRVPYDNSWISLSERPGYLRLRGRESLHSLHDQSLIARRQQSIYCAAETCLTFEPNSFQQMAGLLCIYNHKNFFYLQVTFDDELGKCLKIVSADNGVYDELLEQPISVQGWAVCFLKVEIQAEFLQFSYSQDGAEWQEAGTCLDASKLSDEYCTRGVDGFYTDWGFTGAFIGLCVQDLTGEKILADFDYFKYSE